jgi:MYXO-CTERM domain-containing protein
MLAALLAALSLAVPANAEPSGVSGAPVSPPAAEVTAVVEQAGSPAPVEEAGSSPAPVEQAETTGVTSAASEVEVDVPTEPPEVVSEVEDVASTSPSPATQVKHITSSVPSPDEATRAGLAPEHHMAALVDGVHRRSTETIAAATERLGLPRGGVALLPGLPTTAISDVAEETRPSTATRVATQTTGNPPTPFANLQRRSDLLSSSRAIEPRLKLGEYLTDASSPDTGEVQGPALDHWGIGLSPRTQIAEAAISGPGDRHLGNSAPPDLPPLAPPSPAIAVGDAGGPSSVPAVALLALLALAAPAARRRLGEVAAFRPPTPFVCALERPG